MPTRASDSDNAQHWLNQFDAADQSTAAGLLDAVEFVSSSTVIAGLEEEIEKIQTSVNAPVALYVERELPKTSSTLFSEVKGRATGPGPSPIETKTNRAEVGSEGLLANLVTQLARKNPKSFLSHPSPDQMRKFKPRKFIVLTDFIGSGKRIESYLNAAWRTATLKSWRSYKRIGFCVVAYAGTKEGIDRIAAHRSRPEISLVTACPTIESMWTNNEMREQIVDVCVRYDPVDHSEFHSLGFGGAGVLMVFEHGCPNNCPKIFFKRAKHWEPLFPSRVAREWAPIFDSSSPEETLADKLKALKKESVSSGETWVETTEEGRKLLLFLAALSRGPRSTMAVSAKTGLTIREVEVFLSRSIEWGWVSPDRSGPQKSDSAIRWNPAG